MFPGMLAGSVLIPRESMDSHQEKQTKYRIFLKFLELLDSIGRN